MFSSLSIRNYRVFFIGSTISNIGQWMSRTALSWLVLTELTEYSAQALGHVTALIFLPQMFLAAYAGKLADRFPKRRIMMITQIVMSFNTLILTLLVLTGKVHLWHVYGLTLVEGFALCFDSPARLSIVSEIVEDTQITNAISLSSASFNMARLIGPGLGGVLVALWGTGQVIALNLVSYAAIIIALCRLDAAVIHPTLSTPSKGKVRDGLCYVRRRLDLVILLTCGFAVGGLGFNFTISNAVMATQAYGKAAGEYGILGSMMGLGALAAALLSAARERNRFRHVVLGMTGFAAFSFIAAASPSYSLFAILQALIGVSAVTVLVSANSMLQASSAAQMRGRVMSLWGLMIFGSTPLVSPVVGWLGDTLGPRSTVLFSAVSTSLFLVIIVVALVRSDHLRLRLDRSHSLPRLRLVRPNLASDVLTQAR